MMLSTADRWAKNDILYGGHFCRMENPVTRGSGFDTNIHRVAGQISEKIVHLMMQA